MWLIENFGYYMFLFVMWYVFKFLMMARHIILILCVWSIWWVDCKVDVETVCSLCRVSAYWLLLCSQDRDSFQVPHDALWPGTRPGLLVWCGLYGISVSPLTDTHCLQLELDSNSLSFACRPVGWPCGCPQPPQSPSPTGTRCAACCSRPSSLKLGTRCPARPCW